MSELDGVLFSDGGVEVTVQDLVFSQTITPLFSGNKVLDPKPIVVEGTYYLYSGDKWRKVVITAKDLEKYFNNATRDVAVNYEHNRDDTPKGWVRLRDTKRLDMLETPEGPKTAIFAAIELMPEAAELVAKGVYRDVSIELKPITYEIVGLALTAYPVMRHLQFSDTAEQDLSVEELNMSDKDVLLQEALQEFGITVDELKKLPELLAKAKELEERAREAERLAKFSHIRSELQAKVASKVAPGALDALAMLYLYAEEHSELKFSLDGKTTDLRGLLDEVLAGIEAMSVFGETGVGALQTKQLPDDVDHNRVNEITNIIARRLRFE